MATGSKPVGAPGTPGAIGRARRIGRADVVFAVAVAAIFVVVWVGLVYALVVDRGILDIAWDRLRGLSDPVQLVIWVLFLPIAVGLWIWESPWPPIVGVLLAGGMVVWTIVAVDGLRRAVSGPRPRSSGPSDRKEIIR